MRGRRWVLRAPDAAVVDAMAQRLGLDPVTARLLAGRGVNENEASAFLSPKLRDAMPNPSVLKDMDKAAKVIVDAMEAGKAITVFADYDVDGGTSAAQLIRWARGYGVELGLYVPDRVLEGYGPSRLAFKTLKGQGCDLVITVDCGAAAKLALEAADGIDLSVVVVDHHLMGADLPKAAALVNPNRPDDESGLGYLAAAGVTFLLLVALDREAKARGMNSGLKLLELLGLAALGTVCDVVPLVGLNRAIVAQGLKVLSQRRHVGVQALAEVSRAGGAMRTYDLGFLLGPRINAGGRIGRADMGARMLATDDFAEAMDFAQELDRVNTERKVMQDQIQREALEQAQRIDHDGLPLLVVANPDWHPGIIGIVAGRLKDRFDKPVILIGGSPDGFGKGSGRSIKGVNLGGAIAAAKADGLLLSGGGHAMAGGLTMEFEKLTELREVLAEAVRADFGVARANRASKIDILLAPAAVELSLLEILDRVAPFGSDNPSPTVAVPDLRLTYADRLRGGHVRCTFEDMMGNRLNAMAFRADQTGLEDALFARNPERFHALGTVKRNVFRGRESADFHLVDLAHARGELSYT